MMFVLVFSVIFGLSAGVYLAATSPDARLTKKSREAPFRGELAKEMNDSAPPPEKF